MYEIVDKVDDATFKYGISCETIGKDGMSYRMRKQINYLNRLYEWVRFFGKILQKNIPGKKEARRIEREYIDNFEKMHGRKSMF